MASEIANEETGITSKLNLEKNNILTNVLKMPLGYPHRAPPKPIGTELGSMPTSAASQPVKPSVRTAQRQLFSPSFSLVF
jgi:hypothetical protein